MKVSELWDFFPLRSVLCSPGPSDPERGEFSLGRFAVGGPTSSRLSAILVSEFNLWREMMQEIRAGQVQLGGLRDLSKLATFPRRKT